MPFTKVTTKDGSYWQGKMSVDEVKTAINWKIVYADGLTQYYVYANDAALELEIKQDDESLLKYLNQLPRDMMLTVKYDEDELVFMI